LRFYKKLVIKISSKDVDLLDLESSLLALETLPPNRNKVRSIFMFKPLTSLKGTNRGPRVTSSSTDPSPLALMVKASTKSL
jgi:hypothetical protein